MNINYVHTYCSETHSCQAGDTIENAAGKNCGKYRNGIGKYGLGLLRLQDALDKGTLSVIHKEGNDKDASSTEVGQVENTSMPSWWPRDSDEVIKQILASKQK